MIVDVPAGSSAVSTVSSIVNTVIRNIAVSRTRRGSAHTRPPCATNTRAPHAVAYEFGSPARSSAAEISSPYFVNSPRARAIGTVASMPYELSTAIASSKSSRACSLTLFPTRPDSSSATSRPRVATLEKYPLTSSIVSSRSFGSPILRIAASVASGNGLRSIRRLLRVAQFVVSAAAQVREALERSEHVEVRRIAGVERELAAIDAVDVLIAERRPEQRRVLDSASDERRCPVQSLGDPAPIACAGTATVTRRPVESVHRPQQIEVVNTVLIRVTDVPLAWQFKAFLTRKRPQVEELLRVERLARRDWRDVVTEPKGLGGQGQYEQLASEQSDPYLLEDIFRGLEFDRDTQTGELARHTERSLREAREVVAHIVAGRDRHVVQNALDTGVDDVLLHRRDDQVAQKDETRAQVVEICLRRIPGHTFDPLIETACLLVSRDISRAL